MNNNLENIFQEIANRAPIPPINEVFTYDHIVFRQNFIAAEVLNMSNFKEEFCFYMHQNTPTNSFYLQLSMGNRLYEPLDPETVTGMHITAMQGAEIPTAPTLYNDVTQGMHFINYVIEVWINGYPARPDFCQTYDLSNCPNRKARITIIMKKALDIW